MDGKKFDGLARAIGSGASRRSILKRMLGIGGAVATGGAFLSETAEAARRPTPTPKPVTCPGIQIYVDGHCECPDGYQTCGPDCCPDGQAECCDNACCYGRCIGEELCCEGGSDGDPTVCTIDGCCLGTCYGGPDGISYCCPSSELCNDSECCPSPESACCTTDGCCPGSCYGGEDGRSYCCLGVLCPGDLDPFCVQGGECCDDWECPNDPSTCQTGICDDGICTLTGNGCSTDESCCGGNCCPTGECCENEGGVSICLTADPGNCCTVADCPQTGLPPCWVASCEYDSETGSSWCQNNNTCFGANQVCCDNVCITGSSCPECSENSDCPSTCQSDTMLLRGACVRGECVFVQEPCPGLDPCEIGVCQMGQCYTVPPDTCNPRPGIVCCPDGWTCPIEGGACECRQTNHCADGRCGQCCVDNDCVSNELGSPGCIACGGFAGASCVAINEDQPCNDGFGACHGGYCQSN